MIIFFGYGDDPPLRRALEAAEELSLDQVLIDQQAIDSVELGILAGEGVLQVEHRRLALADLDAGYGRPLSPIGRPGDPRVAERGAKLLELMVDWFDTASGRIVNRPYAMHSNASKPFQAQLIARAGFEVPETLITNDPDEVSKFLAQHGQVIFKSVSGIRSIVRRLDQRYLGRLARVRTLPTQFQAMVPGVDVRVHVIGSELFATQISSAAVDYRYARRDGEEAELQAVELPDEVADRCVDRDRPTVEGEDRGGADREPNCPHRCGAGTDRSPHGRSVGSGAPARDHHERRDRLSRPALSPVGRPDSTRAWGTAGDRCDRSIRAAER